MKDSDLIFGLMASFDKEVYTFENLQHLTAPFHVSVSSLRTNLSRMTTAKLIQVTRSGRKASYGFGTKGDRIKSNVSHGFHTLNWDHWNGEYWGVTFSVPEAHGEARHYIRKKLTKYRFACLNPGFWVRPLHPDEHIPEILENLLSTGYCRLIRFVNHREFTLDQADTLWNLGEINRRFQEALSLLDSHEQALSVDLPELALVQKMTVGNTVVNTLFADPLLPPRFLPSDWQADTLRKQFVRFDTSATECSKSYWTHIFSKEDGT